MDTSKPRTGAVNLVGEDRGVDRWWQAVEVGEPFLDVKVGAPVYWQKCRYRIVGISHIAPLHEDRVVVCLESLFDVGGIH